MVKKDDTQFLVVGIFKTTYVLNNLNTLAHIANF